MYKTKERRGFLKVVRGNITQRNKGLLRRAKIVLSHYFYFRKTKQNSIFPNHYFVEASS